MQEEWWEGLVVFLCRFWWVLLLVAVLAVTAYFMRATWMPTLGL